MVKGLDTRAIRQAMRGVTARGPVGTGKAELPLPPPERKTAPVDDAVKIRESLPRRGWPERRQVTRRGALADEARPGCLIPTSPRRSG
jgi:hypothetical protein